MNDYGGWHLGISTSAMLQCVHLSSFAWDYTDGGEEDPKQLSSEQKKNAIKEYPGLIEFMAAAVCPTQSFTGPASNFMDFMDYVWRRGDFAHIPDTGKACAKKVGLGAVFIVMHLVLGKFYTAEMLRTKEFAEHGVFTRVCGKC